jgi:hypothetical protein
MNNVCTNRDAHRIEQSKKEERYITELLCQDNVPMAVRFALNTINEEPVFDHEFGVIKWILPFHGLPCDTESEVGARIKSLTDSIPTVVNPRTMSELPQGWSLHIEDHKAEKSAILCYKPRN